MAFPTVEGRLTSIIDSNVTSHNIALPAGVLEGELLIVVLSVDGTPTLSWPSGWTALVTTPGGQSPAVGVHAARRVATGGETSVTVTTSAGERTARAAYRISGHDPNTPPEAAGPVSGSSGGADPPSLTPSTGSKEYLWFAVVGVADAWIDAGPTNYTNYVNPNTGTGIADAILGSAERLLETGTEDPGVFALPGSLSWRAATIAVAPAAAPAPEGGFGGPPGWHGWGLPITP